MPATLTWNQLRLDNFTGAANNNYSTSYAPTNYTSLSQEVGMISEKLSLRYWASPTIRLSTVQSSNSVGNGGKVRIKCSPGGGNIAAPYSYGVENPGPIYALYFGMPVGAGTGYYRATAIYENNNYDAGLGVRIAVQTTASDPRVICEAQLSGVTTLVDKELEGGYAVLSASIHAVFVRLFDTDGTTMLGEATQLLYNDWVNSPAVTSSTYFALGGQWVNVDNVRSYDYAYSGALQTPEAYVFSVSRRGTVIVYVFPGQGGTGPYTYQWQKNINGGGWNNVSGGTSTILRETSVTGSVQYRCVVTDAALATATSNVVTCVPGSSICLLVFGDSIPEGNGSGAYTAYNYALKKEFADAGITAFIFNFAAGATTTTYQTDSTRKTNTQTWMTRVSPDAVVLRTSTNDAAASVSTSTLDTNLANGLESITVPASVPLLYLCEPWTGESTRWTNLQTYTAVFAARAAANPSLVRWQGTGPQTATNGQTSMFAEAAGSELHPVKTGYAAIAPLDKAFISGVLVTVTGVTIDQGSTKTVYGEAQTTLTATVAVSSGTSTGVVWSKISGAGSVNSSTGVYTAPGAGQTAKVSVIRATSSDDGTKYAEITITTPAQTGSGGGGSGRMSISL